MNWILFILLRFTPKTFDFEIRLSILQRDIRFENGFPWCLLLAFCSSNIRVVGIQAFGHDGIQKATEAGMQACGHAGMQACGHVRMRA